MKAEIRVNGPLDVPRTLERYRVWGEDPVNRLVDGAFVLLGPHEFAPQPEADL